jgi:hypothetical protein
MKKKFIVLLAGVIFTMATMTGCGNKQVFDFTYTFDNAIIQLPNGQVIEGKIDSWTDYEDGDQIQVKIDGTMYLVHSSNIVLIKK